MLQVGRGYGYAAGMRGLPAAMPSGAEASCWGAGKKLREN